MAPKAPKAPFKDLNDKIVNNYDIVRKMNMDMGYSKTKAEKVVGDVVKAIKLLLTEENYVGIRLRGALICGLYLGKESVKYKRRTREPYTTRCLLARCRFPKKVKNHIKQVLTNKQEMSW